MQTIHISIHIQAPKEKVWNTMLADESYRQWTAAFYPGSYYQGNWEEGSKILFLGPNPEGGGESGMVSRIKECRLYEFISIEHLGVVAHGVEDTSGEVAKDWAGAHENYTFIEKDGGTELVIDCDVSDEEAANMEESWRKGLQVLKGLAEAA